MPGFNLDSMLSSYGDLARGYLFYVSFLTTPVGLEGDDKIHYLVRTASLPPSTIGETTVNWQGHVWKMGTTQEFGDWNVTYSIDPKDNLRADLMKWQQKINDPTTNIHGSPSTTQSAGAPYFGQLMVTHLDNIGKEIMKYKFFGVWPKEVGEVSLDYGSKETANFSVTWSYQLYRPWTVQAGDIYTDGN
jgi:hypothetical protein